MLAFSRYESLRNVVLPLLPTDQMDPEDRHWSDGAGIRGRQTKPRKRHKSVTGNRTAVDFSAESGPEMSPCLPR